MAHRTADRAISFTAYPADIGGLPSHGIRGNVVVIRSEPPRSRSFSSVEADGFSSVEEVRDTTGDETVMGLTPGDACYNPSLGVEEMRSTLLFYTTRSAREIAAERDMRRTLAGMPPEMVEMMGGVPPVGLGTFTMP